MDTCWGCKCLSDRDEAILAITIHAVRRRAGIRPRGHDAMRCGNRASTMHGTDGAGYEYGRKGTIRQGESNAGPGQRSSMSRGRAGLYCPSSSSIHQSSTSRVLSRKQHAFLHTPCSSSIYEGTTGSSGFSPPKDPTATEGRNAVQPMPTTASCMPQASSCGGRSSGGGWPDKVAKSAGGAVTSTLGTPDPKSQTKGGNSVCTISTAS